MTPQPLFLFKILGISFFSFTTLAVCGAALALAAGAARFRAEGRDSGRAVEAFACIVFPALVVGRLVHLLYNFTYFAERPEHILRIADGGFAFVGIFVGSFAGLATWCRWRGERLAWACDAAALPAAICASCAWLGAFWHGSQYGAPVESVFALELRDAYGVVLARTPTQMLAAGWSAVIGLVLQGLKRKGFGEGRDAAVFAILYGLGIGALEFTRGDNSLYILGFRLAQWLYLVLVLVGFSRLGRRCAPV